MAAVAAMPAPKDITPKRNGIDYSKFDNIEDSDDEKPAAPKAAAKEAAPAKPHCHNCHQDIAKPLRCGICKNVSYCSQKCQKDDWQFHKRNCKKPEEPKAKAPAAPKKEASSEAQRKKKEDTVVEDDENLTWYRHREWKPTAEPKKEFTPTQITPESGSAAPQGETTRPAAGSAWNAAGTWEEKDVTALAKQTLKEKLEALRDIDVAGGVLSAKVEDAVEGDASKPVIRGKLRHMFDLSFKVKFSFKWMNGDGQKKADGVVSVHDFTNDTFTEGSDLAPVVELSFKEGAKALDAPRRQAVEAALGAKVWPAPADTLMACVAERMRSWAEDYTQGS